MKKNELIEARLKNIFSVGKVFLQGFYHPSLFLCHFLNRALSRNYRKGWGEMKMEDFLKSMLDVEDLLNKYAIPCGDRVWDYADFFTQDIDVIEEKLLEWFGDGRRD